jgi:hypothetical protein
MTYDGVPEVIKYNVSANSWSSPISWDFSIYSVGEKIFNHSVIKDDNTVHFEDPSYVRDCNDFSDCRMKWYSEKAFKAMIFEVPFNETSSFLESFILQSPSFYMQKFNLDEQKAKESALRLSKFLRDKNVICFTMPDAPVDFGPLMTYDPFHKDFVYFYGP